VTGRIVEPGTEVLDPDADLPIGRILPDGRMTAHFYLRRAAPVAVQHVRGCNWACRRSVLEAAGGFSAAFEHVFEEADLSLRLSRNGRRILFVPGVEVEHRCGPRAHPLRQDDPAIQLARTRAELDFYTLLLARNYGPRSPTFWRFLFTRETGLHGLLRAPSRAALREALNLAAGKARGLARALRARRAEPPLEVRFEPLGRNG
jgi:GT2 family glycosyltransferase